MLESPRSAAARTRRRRNAAVPPPLPCSGAAAVAQPRRHLRPAPPPHRASATGPGTRSRGPAAALLATGRPPAPRASPPLFRAAAGRLPLRQARRRTPRHA
ncbi:hypothetical protein PVAP13_9NG010151 [Panicum virgatum]|uniref:Uncharacterized protein n=1 Tax=Panicum virgatum TaxID=38727 RepID=A0A8T0MBD9_PANVG|nr:hypothetical protein PVAP13_9NG010151 [Panicum virgatum]